MAILRCTESFATSIDGVPTVITAGMIVDDKHAAVKRCPHAFEPVEVTAARTSSAAVEQATSAPGEKRASTPRASAKKA
jgi:hypothetical protein